MMDAEQRSHVERALATLNPNHRTILNLYYLEELSVGEVAQILEIPEGSVKSRLFYARDALKVALNPIFGAPAAAEEKRHEAI